MDRPGRLTRIRARFEAALFYICQTQNSQIKNRQKVAATTIVRRDEKRKERERERMYVMPRVTELTVCQPNTGSTVQLPFLFIPRVDSPAGIYARARDTPTKHLPHPPTHPTLCPLWHPPYRNQ